MRNGTSHLGVFRRDPDAKNWDSISLFGFILHHWNELSAANFALPPKGLEGAWEDFRRYGREPEILEHDLTMCINEFTYACDTLYSKPKDLELKKFAVVYHVDNFYVRVHKLIENVHRLLALMVGLDPMRRPAPGEPPFRQQVRTGLRNRNLRAIIELLRTFEENKWVRKAVESRNLFVHDYRKPEWPMLSPIERLKEMYSEWYSIREPQDSLAHTLLQIDQATDLDRYAARKVDDLWRTLSAMRRFRDQVYKVVLDNYDQLASTALVKTKKR